MTKKYDKTELVGDASWPEGPRWRDGELWFSDVFGGAVWSVSVEGVKTRRAVIDGNPSGLGFLPDGTALVSDMQGRRVLRFDADGVVSVFAETTAVTPHVVNDMIVDSHGRTLLGEMGYDYFAGAEPAPGVLIGISPSGAVREATSGLHMPNGMAYSADESQLLVAESNESRISAFHVAADGSLGPRRTWAETPEFEFLDGISLDTEGGVWVGTHADAAFIRLEEGGNITDRIEMPGRWAIACAHGGPDGKTLFLTSVETDGVDFAASIGRIDRVSVEHAGVGDWH